MITKFNLSRKILVALWPLIALSMAAAGDRKELIDRQPWSPVAFGVADQQGKLMLLNLEVVWCHVRDQKTYQDPAFAPDQYRDLIARISGRTTAD